MESKPKIENWSIIVDESNPYMAPELRPTRLAGRVYGHPGHSEGKFVHTSSIQEIDVKAGYAITKSGTRYQLGKPEQKYFEWLQDQGMML